LTEPYSQLRACHPSKRKEGMADFVLEEEAVGRKEVDLAPARF